jgi:hypothetical protein
MGRRGLRIIQPTSDNPRALGAGVTRLECGRGGRHEVKLVREPAGEVPHSSESSVESCQ